MENIVKDNKMYVISIKGVHLKKILELLRDYAIEATYFEYLRKGMDIIRSIEGQVKAMNDEEAKHGRSC